jgi:hypothetical protein
MWTFLTAPEEWEWPRNPYSAILSGRFVNY